MNNIYFYQILGLLTGNLMPSIKIPRIPNVAYLMMQMQLKRTHYDRKVASHQPGLHAMRVNLATRYRGKR